MTHFARYAVVSGLTWLIDIGLFLALYTLVSLPVALLFSRTAAGVFAFAAHKVVSFSSKDRVTRREIIGYVSLVAANYGLSLLFVSALPTGTLERAGIAKVVVEVVIFVLNFLFLRRLFIPN